MSSRSLQIQAESPIEPDRLRFRFEGVIDVEAVAALEPLYGLPADADIELDFGGVHRINSMGLAQLLKLFEHLQEAGSGVCVSNANRMTSMLFKMTGLDRYLATRQPEMPAVRAENAKPPPPEAPVPTAILPAPPVAPIPDLEPRVAPARTEASVRALHWLVHMQSSRQLNGWYFFNTYLQRRLDLTARLDFADNLLGMRERSSGQSDLVFAKPFDAVRLITRQGYQALARPSDQSDEVTLVARADDPRETLADFAGARVAAPSRDTFVYLLGRYLLDENGIASESMDYAFAGHEIKAVQMLLKDQADLLFIDSESYQRLSNMTRSLLRELDRTEGQFAFHLWCLCPERANLARPLGDLLVRMDRDEQGRAVLAELGCGSWVEPDPADIAMLQRIFDRYAAGAG